VVKWSGQRNELAWLLRVALVTALAGFFATVAHLVAGGSIQSVLGFVLGVLFTSLVSLVSLVRVGFVRVLVAMLVGQYAFHLFLGLGAPNGHHHGPQPLIEPLVASSGPDRMALYHLIAGSLAAVVVASADRALRALGTLMRVLARLLRRLADALSPVDIVTAPLARGTAGPAVGFYALELVGSRGLRGPPFFG
jgi:hypothetical protein